MDDFKRFFFRGLAALLPTLITIALFFWAYDFVDRHIGQHISNGLIHLLALTGPPPIIPPELEDQTALDYGTPIHEWLENGRQSTAEYKIINHRALESTNEELQKRAERQRTLTLWKLAFLKFKLNLIGFVIAIILVYFVGFFLASFLGRATWRVMENLILRIPVVRAIYPNVKQVTDFLFTDQHFEFSGVVAVQYPRKGVWSLGLVTGSPMAKISQTTGKEMMTVFIPSSPTPMTGYTITIEKEDAIELDMSIDEALRFTISGGVIKPGMKDEEEGVTPSLIVEQDNTSLPKE